MGRKAKKRQEKREHQTTQTPEDSFHFVKAMEHRGYEFQQLQRSPEIPENRIDPQL